MNRRQILSALVALAAAPALAQTAPAPAADVVPVAFETSAGRIVIALDRGRAPVTTANFLKYVDAGRFDGESFYRAMKVGETGGLIQGGIRSDSRKLYPAIAHEGTSQTGLKHVAGTVSMANAGPGTAQADFFILTADIPSFDTTAVDAGFAAFGQITEGMDVVRSILAAPVSPTKGDGPMKGQMLEPPVKIIKAGRIN